MMDVVVLLSAVLELEPVFVAGAVSREMFVREEGVGDKAPPLAGRILEADAKGCVPGIGTVDDSAAGCSESLVDELEQWLSVSAADTVDAVRQRVIGRSNHRPGRSG